jgi:hypothetical protein
VSVGYGDVTVLDGFDLVVEPGEEPCGGAVPQARRHHGDHRAFVVAFERRACVRTSRSFVSGCD